MAGLGEIRITAFGVVPPGFVPCDGRLLDINTNQALFALMGTTYGGNGINNFGVPDLRGRVPIHPDNRDFFLGSVGGEETHTLTAAEVAAHAHNVMMQPVPATTSNPNGAMLAMPPSTLGDVYGTNGQLTPMAPGAITSTGSGSSAPHTNMQPYLSLMFIICTNGYFPNSN